MKKIISILLILVLSVFLLAGCGDSGPDLTEVKKKYDQAADILNEAAKLVKANGWKDDAESLKQHNELAEVINGIKVLIEDPEQSKNIDAEAMSKDLDGLISALKEYKAAVSVVKEGYATNEQKKEMVEMLVQMFNGVNTDFNGMIALLDQKGLVVEGTDLTKDLRKFTADLEHVRDGLTGETMTSADAEEFLDKILATDKFIEETIEAHLVD